MYKIRIATEKLEEVNIINAVERLGVMKKLFERISRDEMNNFIDSANVFARTRDVDPEADFVRHHRR